MEGGVNARDREDTSRKIMCADRPVLRNVRVLRGGSGMTAGVLWLGLSILGVKKLSLYDEVEW